MNKRNIAEQKNFYLTKKGFENIKKEYEIMKALRFAKIKGGEVPKIWESEDLNPEYLSFQEDLSFLEKRIAELENILKHLKLIKTPSEKNRGIIGLGATVSVEIDGEADEFKIVGTLEADPSENKISNESPIGRGLMGRKTGETAVIRIPAKNPIINHSCKIIKIKYNKI